VFLILLFDREKNTKKKRKRTFFLFVFFTADGWMGGWVDVCVCSFFGSFELQ